MGPSPGLGARSANKLALPKPADLLAWDSSFEDIKTRESTMRMILTPQPRVGGMYGIWFARVLISVSWGQKSYSEVSYKKAQQKAAVFQFFSFKPSHLKAT